MKTFALMILAAGLLNAADGQSILDGLPQPTRSQSGQFFSYGVPGTTGPVMRPPNLATNISLVELEPWLLTVSAERVKQALWRALDETKPWRGKIYLCLYRAQTPDDSIVITPLAFADGWNYRVDLPDLVDRPRYLNALTHVLLLEIANRNSTERTAEIPLWLREGLAQYLLTAPQLNLIPPLPQWNSHDLFPVAVTMDERRTNLLTRAHNVLRANPALTFDEMSWPSDEDLQGERGAQFRASAQLFVTRLMSLKNGRASLRAMVESLAQYYNWQFALLNAFHNHFGRPLDVEKWWAVNVVEFTGRDLAQTWTPEESWRKLDAALHPAVEVRTDTNQPPLHTSVTLQTIVREWDPAKQTDTLNQAADELTLLQPRLARNVAALAENYRAALRVYLQKRVEYEGAFGAKGRPRIGLGSLLRQTLKTLDALDSKRASLQPKPKPFVTTDIGSLPNDVP